jgi:hypothetical protein
MTANGGCNRGENRRRRRVHHALMHISDMCSVMSAMPTLTWACSGMDLKSVLRITAWPRKRGHGTRRVQRSLVCILLILCTAVLMPGCSGCRKDAAKTPDELEKELAKKKEKPKEPFEAKRLVTQPVSGKTASKESTGKQSASKESVAKDSASKDSPSRDATGRESYDAICKVGHWTGVSLESAVANDYDFVGDMEVMALDGKLQPMPLPASPFNLTIFRLAALPKGQPKTLDSVLYIPPDAKESIISCRLNASRGGSMVLEKGPILKRMPSYQYHFVVMARTPEQYSFLNSLYSIRPFDPNDIENLIEPFYIITQLTSTRHAPLPGHALLWTSTACVLWDDADPAALDPDAQKAFVDWLHWGGQVIISGPDTLDTLKGSFLEPYLPATSSGQCKIGASELKQINDFVGKEIRPLAPVSPWSGIQLQKHSRAEFVPKSGNLLVERRVGRGRIVASAFRLSDREFVNWQGVDEFFNAFLLGHPPRRFELGGNVELKVSWADNRERLDAALISNVRFFTRDAGVKADVYGLDMPKELVNPSDNMLGFTGRYYRNRAVPDYELPPPGPGVAAWNQFSPAADAARKSLLNAAQVEIPDRSFVFLFLLMYLVVLVPFNWSIFHTIDRVEWAWIAAPIVAIFSTGLVIKLAQLDIGFIRARTEIAVLEIQGEHNRAHLTRYNALYTSLSTPYDFNFDDGGAVALPFPSVEAARLFSMAPGQQRRMLRYTRSDTASLEGLPVASNSTALMHSEEMFELGGKISLKQNDKGGLQIVNQTRLEFKGAGLIKKLASENLQIAWLGELQPGAIRTVAWVNRSSTFSGGRLWPQDRDLARISMKKDPGELKGELNIREMLDLAEKLEDMRPGDVKMLAWMETPLPGLKINPSAPQSRHAVMVVAHLDYGFGDPPLADKNTAKKIEDQMPNDMIK